METSTSITLLTIIVIILSVVTIALIVMAVLLIAKLNKIARNIEHATSNIKSITASFSPLNIFHALRRAFKSAKK